MPSFSKNYEATGEHTRRYDQWRLKYANSSSLEFSSLTFVEYSRITAARVQSDWPVFSTHCVAFPHVLDPGKVVDEHELENIWLADQSRFQEYASLAVQMEMPFHLVVANHELTSFLVRTIDTFNRTSIGRFSERDFVSLVINQQRTAATNLDTGIRIDHPILRYSTWHRLALTSSSYLIDVDYIEKRDGAPVAIIEVTRASDSNLPKTIFDFASRGFPQAAVLVQLAETLKVPVFLVVYSEENPDPEFMVLQLTRECVRLMDPLNRQRADLSRRFVAQGQDRRIAQGMACAQLFDQEQDLFQRMLDTTWTSNFSFKEYRGWLLSPSA